MVLPNHVLPWTRDTNVDPNRVRGPLIKTCRCLDGRRRGDFEAKMEDVMTVQCFPLSEVDDGLVPHRRNPGHGTALPEGTVNLHYSRREAETWLSTRQVGSGSPLIRKR